jgi:hypothetical protein
MPRISLKALAFSTEGCPTLIEFLVFEQRGIGVSLVLDFFGSFLYQDKNEQNK